MKQGTRVTTIDLLNEAETAHQAPLAIETLPGEDWFFRTMNEAIAENRLREDEAGRWRALPDLNSRHVRLQTPMSSR